MAHIDSDLRQSRIRQSAYDAYEHAPADALISGTEFDILHNQSRWTRYDKIKKGEQPEPVNPDEPHHKFRVGDTRRSLKRYVQQS